MLPAKTIGLANPSQMIAQSAKAHVDENLLSTKITDMREHKMVIPPNI
ncbi:hypothetical protein A0J51_03285 [Gluconobacter japonicus]|nr:hypothetical protein A0J51_03285 [Gluconobacter japonicus]